MNQDNPNSGWNTTGGTGSTGGSMGGGSTTGGTGTSGGSGSGSGSGTSGSGSFGSGSGSSAFGDSGGSAFGAGSATDSGVCPTCGHSARAAGLEQFLGRLGITEDMISNLKGQFQNVDIDEYMNTARDYLKDTSNKASSYTKENPGKVAAGVAALALGAGLLYAAVNRDKS